MAVELKPRIVVIGVGGAGGNAVNNMIEADLQGVEFVVANTDAQAIARSKAEKSIQLGVSKTAGMGAGANPEVGAEAARESAEEIKQLLKGAHMCFIAAGMGGGTGTGAAPIIARIAREQKVLTVGVVTKPFDFEGKRRMSVADRGIEELRDEVDTLIIIPNQNLFRIASRETTFAEAFHMADRVLYSGVRGITDLMVMPGLINLDFADVNTVMAGMGTAMMGEGEAAGEERALKAARAAIANPLLDDVSMQGAKGVIINITGGYDMTLFEVDEAANEIRREVDTDANIILGSTFDENMDGKIRVSVVAAGVTRLDVAQKQSGNELFDERTARFRSAAAVPAAEPEAVEAEADIEDEAELDAEIVEAEVIAEAPRAPGGPVIRTRPVETEPDVIEHEAAEEEPFEEDDDLVEFEAEDEPQAADAAEDDFEAAPAAPAPSGAHSFKKLFGWGNKSSTTVTTIEPREEPRAEAEDDLDDELEIPAFLRRSANS